MAFFEKTKITDEDGQVIHPAREDGILVRIFNLLSSPLGYDKSLARQRVTALLEAGTNAVGTVSISAAIPAGTNSIGDIRTLTNIGGTGVDARPAQMLINQTNLSAWADCVRSCIT